MTYLEWKARHPLAAQELEVALGAAPWNNDAPSSVGRSEAWAQQQVRFLAARQGAWAMRNNVGATAADEMCRCPRCYFEYVVKRQPIRYGLANDSAKLNAVVKSSDLILCIPRTITSQMVGQVIGQFGAVEVKKPDWRPGEDPSREGPQFAFGARVLQLGGFFTVSRGELLL